MLSKTFLLSFAVLFITGLDASKLRQEARKEFKKGEFVYDLNAYKPQRIGRGGKIDIVTQEQWPALENQGISMMRIRLEPCGLNVLHEHPRPSEIMYVNKGKNIFVGFVEEDGGRVITNTLKKGDVTLFPETLIHFQQNLGCEDAELLAFLSSEDPGYVTIGAESFKFPPHVVASSFGMSEEYVEKIRKGMPYSPVEASRECHKRCKYEKKEKYGKSESYEREEKYEKPKYEREEKYEKPKYEREEKYEKPKYEREEKYEKPKYEREEKYEKPKYEREEKKVKYAKSEYEHEERDEDEEDHERYEMPKYEKKVRSYEKKEKDEEHEKPKKELIEKEEPEARQKYRSLYKF
jgi:oxalate decarboxylase/phosphoglucose isomerase-like protein (cupin superfamily)